VKFERLLEIVGSEPVFESSLLAAGRVDLNDIRRQLSRWIRAGRVHQLRRGVYALAPPYQKVRPHPFVLANRLVRGSYVSCQSALAYHGLIPEVVPSVTSICTSRPASWDTALGRYEYRTVKRQLFFGFDLVDLGDSQRAFIASLEKALLDLIYLTPGADSESYLAELRLQNLERLDRARLQRHTDRAGRAKLMRALSIVTKLVQAESEEYELL
jgi:predicted transcriptional regulator of viral defense system